jgi:MHS family proline/betaine transporter-like MFS transporter
MRSTVSRAAPKLPVILAAGAIGNILEWFDFAVYGFFAVFIGKTFFPQSDPAAQVIGAFGIFAIGYLARPLGGVLIGHIGDRHGRKFAMTLSVGAMAIPTFLIGILPGYEAIGIAAPILLTLLRTVQGLSLGGEYTTSMIFMVEHAPPHRRSFAGAVAVSGAIIGILFGSATAALLAAAMPSETLAAWGWRLPFLSGLAIGVMGLYVRRHLPEGERNSEPAAPLMQTLRHYPWEVFTVALLCLVNAVGFQIVFVYLVSWLQLVDKIAPVTALEINTASMVVLLVTIFIAGLLADRFGNLLVMAISAFGIVVLAIPLFHILTLGQPSVIMASQMIFAVLLGLYIGAQPGLIVLHSPKAVRCTALAIGYNVTLGLVGGTSPLMASWLIERLEDNAAPGYLIAGMAALSFCALWPFLRKAKSIKSAPS